VNVWRKKQKGINAARGADHDALRPAQENAETFFFNGSVKAADHSAAFRAPALR
jgi:hypothetical protein